MFFKRVNILKKLQTHINSINRQLNDVTTVALQTRGNIELEIKSAEFMFDTFNLDLNNNNMHGMGEDNYDEYTLVLEEGNNDDLDSDPRTLAKKIQQKKKHELEKKYQEIEEIACRELQLDILQNHIKTGQFYKDIVDSVNSFLPEYLKGNI